MSQLRHLSFPADLRLAALITLAYLSAAPAARAQEFEPRQYVVLRAAKENEWLLKGFTRVLGMKPHFQFQDKQGQFVTEWRMSGREARWSSMQGIPTYKNAKRLYITEE